MRELPPDARHFVEHARNHGWKVNRDWAGFDDERHWVFAERSNASITPSWRWTRGKWTYRGASVHFRHPKVLPLSFVNWRRWERTGQLNDREFCIALRLLSRPSEEFRRFCNDELGSERPMDDSDTIPF